MTLRTSSLRGATASIMACLLVLALAACSSAPSSVGSAGTQPSAAADGSSKGENLNPQAPPQDGGALVFGVPGEAEGWNPHKDKWAQWSSFAGSSILEPLAMVDENSDAHPWLAHSWSPNSTFDEWTITLRDGVKFSNGEPFDAAAVKLNIEDTMKAPLMGLVVGPLLKRVEIIDEHTVKVTTTSSWAVFPAAFLGSQAGLMMAPAMLKSDNGGSANPIGTGPFVFQEWKRDASLKTSKNPTYWRKGEPHLDSIEFRVITDPSSLQRALEARDVDMIFTPSADNYAALHDKYQAVKNWTNEPMMVVTNTLPTVKDKPNPLSNLHVRRALALATDRDTIAQTIGNGVLPASQIFSPDGPWGLPDDQNPYPAFDLEKAKAEVEAYKKETGASTVAFTLLGTADSLTTRLMQLLQSQWQLAGIEAMLENSDATAFLTRIATGDYETAVLPLFSASEPDLDYPFLASASAKGPHAISINMSQFSNAKTEEALQIGRSTTDRTLRKKAYNDLVRELNANAVFIWLYWTPYSIIADKRVHGLQQAATIPFAHLHPKEWFGELWVSR